MPSTTYAGRRDARGQLIAPLALLADFDFGDSMLQLVQYLNVRSANQSRDAGVWIGRAQGISA